MAPIRAITRALLTSSALMLVLAVPSRSDTLADFRSALARASTHYDDATAAVATGSQEEAKAAVQQLRQAWQEINVRFAGDRPAPRTGRADRSSIASAAALQKRLWPKVGTEFPRFQDSSGGSRRSCPLVLRCRNSNSRACRAPARA